MHLYVDATQGAHFQPQNMTLLICWHRYSYFWLLLLSLLFSLPTQASPTTHQKEPLPDLASQPPLHLTEQQVASLVQQTAILLSAKQPGQQAARAAVNQANRLASQTSERWLSRFGRARVNLSTDHRFKQFQGELAVLLPLDESCSRPLTFSQLAINYFDSEPVANLGIGQRHLLNGWLLGYNAFIDQHLQQPHTRLGIGAELWRDYLKISGNSYWGLSHWKESKKIEYFEEKVANGFDLRLQSYLPHYPQLGGQLMLENYFGDQVALFEKTPESLQKKPLAATVGITYTPVPLITVGVDHKMGKKSQKETRFNLQFDYLLDLPWEQQIDPKRVSLQRQLALSKYDWVQRNNRLVMQYRQLAQITLELPPLIEGYPGEQKPLDANVTARFGFKEIEWNSSELITAGGNIKLDNDTRYQVSLPTAIGTYSLSGIAIDQQGNRSTVANTQIKVTPWISLSLPDEKTGKPKEVIYLHVKTPGAFKLVDIKWAPKEFEAFKADGGKIELNLVNDNAANINFTLPEQEKSYRLTATAVDEKGNQSSPATITITISKNSVDPDPKPLKIINPDNVPKILLYDEKIKLSAEGGNGIYQWESTQPAVLAVDNNGNVTVKGAGKAQIKLSSDGNEVQTKVELLSNKPLLDLVENSHGSGMTYAEVVDVCNQAKGKIVTKQDLDNVAKERGSWNPLAQWAGLKGKSVMLYAEDPSKQLQVIFIGGKSGTENKGEVEDITQESTVEVALCRLDP